MNKKIVLCLIYNQNQILLQLRNLNSRTIHPGTWGYFSGMVKINENPKNAIKRELYEELRIISFKELKLVFQYYDEKTKSNYFIYIMKSPIKKFKLCEGLDLCFFKSYELFKKKKSKKIDRYFNCADSRLMKIFFYKCKKIFF